MRTFAFLLACCSVARSETVLIEWEVGSTKHRVVYDQGQLPLLASPGFRQVPAKSAEVENGSGLARWYHGASVNMWTTEDESFVNFLGLPRSDAHSLTMRFNAPLSWLPSASDLRRAQPISHCGLVEGFHGPEPARRCATDDVPANVNWMSLGPVFELFGPGDVNRDHRVTFQDFVQLANSFPSVARAEAVPEPSTLVIALLLTPPFIWRSREGKNVGRRL